jgi:hypothetical protein
MISLPPLSYKIHYAPANSILFVSKLQKQLFTKIPQWGIFTQVC